MDLAGYLRAIRKGWWVIVACILLGLAGAATVVVRSPQVYATSLTFFVNTSAGTGASRLQDVQYAQQRVSSYVILASSERVARMVLEDTQLTMSVGAVSSTISASSPLNTAVLDVTVKDTSASRSKKIATSLSVQLVRVVHDTDSTVDLELFSGPTLNPEPVSPRTKLDLALGALVGVMVGVALAMFRQLMDNSVRSVRSLGEITAAPVLGVIPLDASAKKAPLIAQSHARSRRAEAFRQLRTNLRFIDADRPAKVMLVTSSIGMEGKSTTATNLAISFAETDQRILLIEADLRRPRVSEYLGIERSLGLTNVLAEQAKIEDVLQPWGTGNLIILPSGTIPPNPSELLGSQRMQEFLARSRSQFDLIIIDSPPLLPVTDAAVLAACADGAVIVVRAGKTKRQQVATAAASLRAVDARILGCVLNMAPAKGPDAQLAYDAYGYYEEARTRVRPDASKRAPGQAVLSDGPLTESRGSAAAVDHQELDQ